jgi:hypothetical protein
MKKHLILLLATLLFASQPSAAQEDFSIAYGPGAQSCGSMLSFLDKQWRDTREEIENTYIAWMQGYLSALNYLVNQKFDGAGVNLDDAHAHFRWLLNYCEENPLDMVPKSIEKLYEALVLRTAE